MSSCEYIGFLPECLRGSFFEIPLAQQRHRYTGTLTGPPNNCTEELTPCIRSSPLRTGFHKSQRRQGVLRRQSIAQYMLLSVSSRGSQHSDRVVSIPGCLPLQRQCVSGQLPPANRHWKLLPRHPTQNAYGDRWLRVSFRRPSDQDTEDQIPQNKKGL